MIEKNDSPDDFDTNANEDLRFCLHVTSADAIASILKEGLTARIGPLSSQVETRPSVFMFPSWEDLENANWLFEEWPHDSEPALLGVLTSGLDVRSEVGFEVLTHENIGLERIMVLASTESGWDACKENFLANGGKMTSQNIVLKSKKRIIP